jgi:hypothetical protein
VSVIDGRALFGCSLAAWPDHPLNGAGFTMRMLAAGRGIKIPPLSAIDETAAPLVVWVQQGTAVVSCPTCAENPAEEKAPVWLEGPLLACCMVCGSGGTWRHVVLPDQWEKIVAALAARPLAGRTWVVGETVEQICAENAQNGWGKDDA